MIIRTKLVLLVFTTCFLVAYTRPRSRYHRRRRPHIRPKRSPNLRIRCGERIDFDWQCYCDRPSVLLTLNNAKDAADAYLICGIDQELVILAKTPKYTPLQSGLGRNYNRFVKQERPRTILNNNKYYGSSSLGMERKGGIGNIGKDYRTNDNPFGEGDNINYRQIESNGIDHVRSNEISSERSENLGSSSFENLKSYVSDDRHGMGTSNNRIRNPYIQNGQLPLPFSKQKRSINLQTVEILCNRDIYERWYCYCQQQSVVITLPSSDIYSLSCESDQVLTVRTKVSYYQPAQSQFAGKIGVNNPPYPANQKNNILDTEHRNPFDSIEQSKMNPGNNVGNSHLEKPQPLSQHASDETPTDYDNMISQEKLDNDLQEAMLRLRKTPETTPTTTRTTKFLSTAFTERGFKFGGKIYGLLPETSKHESNADVAPQSENIDTNPNNYNTNKSQTNTENADVKDDSKHEYSISSSNNDGDNKTILPLTTYVSKNTRDKTVDTNVIKNKNNDEALTGISRQQQKQTNNSVRIYQQRQSDLTTMEMDSASNSTTTNRTDLSTDNDTQNSDNLKIIDKAPCSFYGKDLQIGEGAPISISCKMVCKKKNVLRRECFGK